MTDWIRRLNVHPEWAQAQEGEITVAQLAKVVSERLSSLEDLGNNDLDYEKENLAEEFMDLADDPEANIANFDYIMDRLYDWADQTVDDSRGFFHTKKVCWINASFPPLSKARGETD